MTSNSKPPPQGKESPTEPFKRAVAGCMRAIAGVPDLEVGYAADRPLLSGHKAAPQPAGRGRLIRRGERPVLVQTAFTPPGHLAGAAPGMTHRPPAGDRVR